MKPTSITTRNLTDMTQETDNVYKSLFIISRRARQIASRQKEELDAKLSDFATTVDNLEEIFENREQIEISKFYERQPKPTLLAIDEFMEDKVYYSDTELEEGEEL